MTREPALFRWDEIALEKITEMVTRKVIAGTQVTIVQAYFKKGTLVPLHAHPVEIVVYVLQGALRVRARTMDESIVREGEVIVVPAGLEYQVESLDDTFVVVVTPATAAPAVPAGRPAASTG